MTRMEWAELALIALAIGAGWALVPHFPRHTSIGGVVTTAAGVVLAQSLLRDLAILMTRQAKGPERRLPCLCLESLVGATGVAVGIALALLKPAWSLTMAALGWILLFGGTLVAGFLIKDLVLTWWPLRIRHDRDHLNVIVSLR